jgi:DNA-binding NtrC family response regulator
MTNERILIIDDEPIMQEVLTELLATADYEVKCASTGEEGLELFASEQFDLIICDIMLPGENGIEILKSVRRINPDQPVIMITAYASVENAIEAMKKGAQEYITKPFKNEEVLLHIKRAISNYKLLLENRDLRNIVRERFSFSKIIGKNHKMHAVYDLISMIAPTRSTVLVAGESGTGKELVAKAIHTNSPRANRPFVTVNSGSMPSDLLESNLFGHMRGSFTGAVANKKGLFETADTGTIFFDEIGNLGADTQAKLLRVIQEKEFMRLGGNDTIKVDVRIIAATNSDLKDMVSAGTFREDLYYRLNVIKVDLPPLRERKDDIILLANHFTEKYCDENDKAIAGLTPGFLGKLMDYNWPGNVRELENAIERAVVLNRSGDIEADLVPDYMEPSSKRKMTSMNIPPEGINLKNEVAFFEAELIKQALEITGGVQKKAAVLLNMKPSTLNEMIKRMNLQEFTR